MNHHISYKKIDDFPRVPLECSIDLTFRCNNTCRHCWINLPQNSSLIDQELTYDEIKTLVDDSRALGCRNWTISGGEPMLRPDFADIFDYITAKAAGYTLNTNGTLITHDIARLMKRKGVKLIALYGATQDTHDHITRHRGSFAAVMNGIELLKSAGAGFMIQIIPMRDNYHQLDEMKKIAGSLCGHYRIGAPWLYLSADGDEKKNLEITRQRLSPVDVVELDKPGIQAKEWLDNDIGNSCYCFKGDERLFSDCINNRRDFYIDPYGLMSFCSFIKSPGLQYDLRKGSVKEGWERFIPAVPERIRGDIRFKENCGSCKLNKECRWCPAYAFLEHRQFSAPVKHLCDIAKENRNFKIDRQHKNRRFYKIADMAIMITSDLPVTDKTFVSKFKSFETDKPVSNIVHIHHHFFLPDLDRFDLNNPFYKSPPWAIYRNGDQWIYTGYMNRDGKDSIHQVAVFNNDHSTGHVYNIDNEIFINGGLQSLSMFPTDQIIIARILGEQEGCYFHAAGIDLDNKGMLFVGHSNAGKSTITTMLKNHAKILCDDRIIMKKHNKDFQIYGTWNHGDIPLVSADSAPLKGIFFLNQAKGNKITQVKDKQLLIAKLLGCMIKPLVTNSWMENMMILVENIIRDVPCYELSFDKSGEVVNVLKKHIST